MVRWGHADRAKYPMFQALCLRRSSLDAALVRRLGRVLPFLRCRAPNHLDGKRWRKPPCGSSLSETEQSFPSTTWEWRLTKIRRPPLGQSGCSPKARRFFHLPSRNPRERLTLTITYRGGGEAWYEIHARGSVGRWPGYVALHDVMSEINQSR